MNKDFHIPTILAAAKIMTFGYISSRFSLIVTFVPGVILALIFYFLTFFKNNLNQTEFGHGLFLLQLSKIKQPIDKQSSHLL